MRVVRIEDAGPGMRVAKEVLDLRGTLLYKAGTELTPQIIETLRTRNITHLFMDDSPAAAAVGVDAGQRSQQIDEEIDRLFVDVTSNPLMGALRDSAKKYLKSKVK